MSHDNSLFKLYNKLSYIVVDIKVTDTGYLFISTPYSMIFKMHKNPSQIRRMLIQILKNTPKSQDLGWGFCGAADRVESLLTEGF